MDVVSTAFPHTTLHIQSRLASTGLLYSALDSMGTDSTWETSLGLQMLKYCPFCVFCVRQCLMQDSCE